MKRPRTEPQIRNTETKARIKRALIELIDEKGLDALTVSDIARRAGINRGTFYLHYVDKFDLLEQLENEAIQGLSAIVLRDDRSCDASTQADLFPYETLVAALDYVASELDFVSAISSKNGDLQFSAKVRGVIESLFEQGLKRTGRHVEDSSVFPRVYAREVAISHALAIISLWFRRGCKDPSDQVARMIRDSTHLAPEAFVS